MELEEQSEEEQRSSLIQRICAFSLVEALYASLPGNTIRKSINTIYAKTKLRKKDADIKACAASSSRCCLFSRWCVSPTDCFISYLCRATSSPATSCEQRMPSTLARGSKRRRENETHRRARWKGSTLNRCWRTKPATPRRTTSQPRVPRCPVITRVIRRRG